MDDVKSITGSILYQGKEYPIDKILVTQGSLDVIFITLKRQVKSLSVLKSDWDSDDILCKHADIGEKTITCGFPVDGTDSKTSDITIGNGEILSSWFY